MPINEESFSAAGMIVFLGSQQQCQRKRLSCTSTSSPKISLAALHSALSDLFVTKHAHLCTYLSILCILPIINKSLPKNAPPDCQTQGPLLRGRWRTILQMVTDPFAASLAHGRALRPASKSSPRTQVLAEGILWPGGHMTL